LFFFETKVINNYFFLSTLALYRSNTTTPKIINTFFKGLKIENMLLNPSEPSSKSKGRKGDRKNEQSTNTSCKKDHLGRFF
jgi:hypothetical protein